MSANLNRGYTFGATEQVTNTKLHNLVDNGTVSNIDQTNITAGSGLVITSTTQPSDTDALWMDSSGTKVLKFYNGSVWAVTASVPTNYRSQMYVAQASTTTITVAPGILEVNGNAISKTSNTTLTISTASDWAGGSSLRAVSTTAYVGVDASGNIKMHTQVPTHADYAVSITAANNTKRYATWSGTVYRIIGWFRMNATGSGELDTFGVSNLADGAVRNVVEFQTGAVSTGTTALPEDDTIPQITEGDQYMSLNFVPTNVNNKLRITVTLIGTSTGGDVLVALFQDATAGALASAWVGGAVSVVQTVTFNHHMKAATTALTTFRVRAGSVSGTFTFNGQSSGRFFGGVLASSIKIEELESELT